MNVSIHNKAKALAAFAAATCAVLASANNTTYYVSPSGDDSADGMSWGTAFKTAAKGFSMANTSGGNTGNNGNTVIFAAGTYQLTDAIGCTGASYEGGRTRVIGATENPEDVVLRGKGDREVLRLATGITVANLTIENGTNEGRTYRAAGVRVGANTGTAAPTTLCIVSNCVIRSCHNAYASGSSSGFGGPVIVHNDGLLVDCVVSNNTAAYRGCGVTLGGAYAKALRCVITGNGVTASDAGASVLGANNDFKAIGGGQLIDCTVSNNVAPIYAGALNVAVVSGCTFENNQSQKDNGTTDASRGGGLVVNACNATVSDCIFRGNASGYGAGADVGSGSSASFTNCLFEGNVATYGGGGAVVAGGSSVSFDDCRFLGNRTTSTADGQNHGGGGILLYDQTTTGWCSVSNSVFGGNETGGRGGAFAGKWNAYFQATIENCVFTNNVSYRQGGAISLREDSSHTHADKVATIRNCLVANNRTTFSGGDSNAGGIYFVTYNAASIENCTIVSNVSAYSGGGGVYHRWGGQLVNCIFAFNKKTLNGALVDESEGSTLWTYSGGTYLNCCSYPTMTSHMTAANGCINEDPKFMDAANGDFTLKRSSPCRNAGTATADGLSWMAGAFDLSGAVARISESKPDIGCYESREMSTHSVLIFH